MQTSRLKIILVLAIVLVIGYFWMKSPAKSSYLTWDGLQTGFKSLISPNNGNKDVLGGLDAWFRDVTGLSITQLIMAVWRLIIWIVMFVLKLLWSFVAWGLALVRK